MAEKQNSSPYLIVVNFLVKSSMAKMMWETRTPSTMSARADLTMRITIMVILVLVMIIMMEMTMIRYKSDDKTNHDFSDKDEDDNEY